MGDEELKIRADDPPDATLPPRRALSEQESAARAELLRFLLEDLRLDLTRLVIVDPESFRDVLDFLTKKLMVLLEESPFSFARIEIQGTKEGGADSIVFVFEQITEGIRVEIGIVFSFVPHEEVEDPKKS